MSEIFYDEKIAPEMFAIAKKCEALRMPFFAAVEYEPRKIARTMYVPNDASLQMVMLNLCGHTGVNVDGYLIALKRYCRDNGVDVSGSIFLTR